MINLQIKFEVSIFTHYKEMKGNAIRRNWDGLGGGLGITNVKLSLAMSPFNRVHMTSYLTLI